ncbi:DUF6034 family protein [Eubacteriales bacterium OttesenSCG-928-K08]|nr:DUF6034 family protein [Eubacteriales bacterium OttesenSCG-928-K08]
MKKVILFCMAMVMLSGALAGCQKTPESPIVIQKDLGNLMELAEQNGAADAGQSLSARLDAPERLTMQLTSKGGKLHITVDAPVLLPQVDQLPMVRVGHGQFDVEDAKRYVDVLFGDAIPLDPMNTPQTKAQIQKSIEGLQALKEQGELDKYESVEEIDAAIAELMKEAATAPDAFTPSEHVFEWHSPDVPVWDLRAAPDATTISDLHVQRERIEYCRNLDQFAALSMVLASGSTGSSNEGLLRKADLTVETGYTPEQAYALAMDTTEQLQIKDMACTGRRGFTFIQYGFSAYEFMFTRTIQGVTLAYTNDEGNKFALDSVAETWMFERIRIFIDEAGVSYFQYSGPHEILETVSEDVQMLSFPEIQNIFERMAPVVNNFYDEYGRECEMHIHEVRLGLMRVTERNAKQKGMIIPVWDFMGTLVEEPEEDGYQYILDDQYSSILTINAIDGSIIDRGLGY